MKIIKRVALNLLVVVLMSKKSSFSEKQLAVINDIGKKQMVMHVGSMGCGKTYSIEVALGLLCLKLNKAGITGLDIVLLGKSQKTVKENQCNTLSKLFGENFRYDAGRRDGRIKDAVLFDQYITIIGFNDNSAESKFRGLSNIFCMIHDEAIMCTEEQLLMVLSRLRGEFSSKEKEVFKKLGINPPFYIGSTNPDSPEHWLKKKIDNNDFDDVIVWTLHDARWDGCLEYYSRLQRLYPEGSIYRERYIDSKWVAAEGSIFKDFLADTNRYLMGRVNPSDFTFASIGIDFGGHKSGTSLVCVGYYSDRKRGLCVLHSDRLIGNKGEINPDKMNNWIITQLRSIKMKYPNLRIADINCDNAEQYLESGVRNAVRKAGLGIPVSDALKRKIIDRIKFIQNMMGMELFQVMTCCETLISCLKSLVYDPKSNVDKILDDGSTDNDTFDAFCYAFEKQMNRFNYI